MSLKYSKQYLIICDRCGASGESDGLSSTSAEQVISKAQQSSWKFDDGLNYCPRCIQEQRIQTEMASRAIQRLAEYLNRDHATTDSQINNPNLKGEK